MNPKSKGEISPSRSQTPHSPYLLTESPDLYAVQNLLNDFTGVGDYSTSISAYPIAFNTRYKYHVANVITNGRNKTHPELAIKSMYKVFSF